MARSMESHGLLGLDFRGNSADNSVSRILRHLGQRSLRSKLTALLVLSLLFWFLVGRTSQPTATSELYSDHPSEPRSPLPDDEIPPPARTTPIPDAFGNVPVTKQKHNPSFHLLIRQKPGAPERSPQLCRTLYTSMVLDYPPPTLIKTPGRNSSIAVIDKYLSGNEKFNDDDVVLIVDESDVWFQLPPDLLIQRFYNMLREKNKKLRWRYGKRRRADGESVQVYSERIIFGADKVCHTNVTYDPACAAVPHSTLMPDIYGPDTDVLKPTDIYGFELEIDESRIISNFRPRWPSAGAVMGLMGDLKLLYNRAAELETEIPTNTTEQLIMEQIFGEQEYVREMYRLTSGRGLLTRLGESMGLFDTVDLSNVTMPVVQGKRYDYGIGLDYQSDLFFTMYHTENDHTWLKYDDVETLSEIQRQHGVPREHRLILPDDIAQLPNPFTPTQNYSALPATSTSTSPSAAVPTTFRLIDYLPHPVNASWENIRLATNVRTGSVPPVLHFNHTLGHNTGAWWPSMWFHPYSRALLRKYIRSTQEPDAVASSLQGGSDAWDTRGGRGGVWNDHNEWKGWAEVCRGNEGSVFRDQLGQWGKESGGGHEAPVYNQWGMLVSGDPS